MWVRKDPWYWLRDDDRQDPEVLSHFRDEVSVLSPQCFDNDYGGACHSTAMRCFTSVCNNYTVQSHRCRYQCSYSNYTVQLAAIIRCSGTDAGNSAATATIRYSLQQLYSAVAQITNPIPRTQLRCHDHEVTLVKQTSRGLARNLVRLKPDISFRDQRLISSGPTKLSFVSGIFLLWFP